jgi:hypothetical protein
MPAQWPKVVGTISIVWASIGLLCSVCGVGWMAATPYFMANAEKQLGEPVPDVMKPGTVQIAVGAAGTIAPALLLVAGILTVRRRAAGRGLHLLYALVGMVMTTAGAVLGVQQQLRVMEWAKQNASSKWAQASGSSFGLIIVAVMVALGFAWPLFCLLWFGAVKRDMRDLQALPAQD